ncbi:unnamed protein product [Arctogadus glacialis]
MLGRWPAGRSWLRTGLQHLRTRWCSTREGGPQRPEDDMIRRTPIQRVLCVAEKNDAAKCIAEIMSDGRARRREGMSKFNKIYEYDYHLFGQNVSVSMTSVSGHLLGLEFKAPFQKWHSCNPVMLFDAVVEKYCPENMVQLKRSLEKEVRSVQALVIWTDCDREERTMLHEMEQEEKVEFSWKRNRLYNHTACLVLYQICMEDPMATVTSVTSKPKSKWRPLPLDTVEMEKLSSRKLKINAKETMKIAEKLYTQGFISYPRTETNIFPKDLALGPLVEHQTQSPSWGAFAQRVLEQPGGPNPRQGKKTDQAHPPIHPTKYGGNLQGNEGRVYEFIVRHFLACVSQDAVGQETVVDVDIAHERFSASGLMIIARNYLDVYPYDRWSTKVIPVYQQGSQFQPTAIEMVDGQTSPPQLLTESDLIALMEKHGIGTDATHADHIETIKSRMYVGLTADQRFLPGELGMGLVEGYNSMGYEMSKPNLRSELEADLKLVSEGRKDKTSVLRNHIHKYKHVFQESVRCAKKLDEALAPYLGAALEFTEAQQEALEVPLPVRRCPGCGRDMVLRTKREGSGKFMSCTGYPECKAAVWFPDTVLEVSRDDSVCDTCQPRPVHIRR